PRRRRMAAEETPPCRAWRVRERLIKARNFGLVLSAIVSTSAFLTETTAATGLPFVVTTTGPRFASRAYFARGAFAFFNSMVVIAVFPLRQSGRCCAL